jgi:hypothetical protein
MRSTELGRKKGIQAEVTEVPAEFGTTVRKARIWRGKDGGERRWPEGAKCAILLRHQGDGKSVPAQAKG